MERATQNLTGAAKFRQSIGAGFSALGGSTNYFSLEFLTSDDFHKAGSREDVIVNYIEIGRDSSCGIRISDKYPTVSRKHAAIQKEGNQYILIHLSKSNPTLLNGRPVQHRWYLQNGDTIQLSLEGPKMTFLIPKNNKANSISLTRRLSLFGKQALRPYKTALAVMSVLLLLTLSGGGYYIWQDSLKDKQFQQELADAMKRAAELEKQSREQNDSLMAALGYSQEQINNLRRQLTSIPKNPIPQPPVQLPPASQSTFDSKRIKALVNEVKNDVFFMYMIYESKSPDGKPIKSGGSCTCFLTDEGKLVTAKHCIASFLFNITDFEDVIFNRAFSFGDFEIKISIYVFSPDGRKMQFDGKAFTIGRAKEKIIKLNIGNDQNPQIIELKDADLNDDDWAYIQTPEKGIIKMDRELARSLEIGSELIVLGYPKGFGADIDKGKINPLFSMSVVAQDGLDSKIGTILATTTGTSPGNSGGPVFAIKDNKLVAVGILSGGISDLETYVPVSQIPQ
ncbi:MAG: FHA domain-containing protein [Thermaurantimonas sp.]|uniref:FHA domain-containing protein n=1 Tax=Thermaurantimonas sp. TaxID=2681568 RepID=UPI00391DAD95